MTQQPGLSPVGLNIGEILSVSPFAEDHSALEGILKGATAPGRNSTWHLSSTATLSSALTALRREEHPVVVCERDLAPGTWKDLVENIQSLAIPIFVIVTSRLADERLWAEALNFGAYDVLAKPFYPPEVTRVIRLASERSLHQREVALKSKIPPKAACPATLAARSRVAVC